MRVLRFIRPLAKTLYLLKGMNTIAKWIVEGFSQENIRGECVCGQAGSHDVPCNTFLRHLFYSFAVSVQIQTWAQAGPLFTS